MASVSGNMLSLSWAPGSTGGTPTQVGSDVKTANGIRAQGVAMSADGNTIALGFVYGSPRRVSVFSVTP